LRMNEDSAGEACVVFISEQCGHLSAVAKSGYLIRMKT
jgi:hypothetical protein